MKILTAFASCIFCIILSQGQSFDTGWQMLNDKNVPGAVDAFEKSIVAGNRVDECRLALTMLYGANEKERLAQEHFQKFYESNDDPYAEVYAMWYLNGVLGAGAIKDESELDLLEMIEDDDNCIGKVEIAARYLQAADKTFTHQDSHARKLYNKTQVIDNWKIVGPFDDVMNSGYDKEFGPIAYPRSTEGFVSKYGAKVNWYDPGFSIYDNYFATTRYSSNRDCIHFAQSFVELEENEECLLKMGYSGVVKLWVNDSLIYANQEPRDTELDHYAFKIKLNAGYNRFLVQLGDYRTSYPSFSLRLTDHQHQDIEMESSSTYQEYSKGLSLVEEIPHWAISELEAEATDDNVFRKILLVKAYLRIRDLNNARQVMDDALALCPENYLVLRQSILMADEAGDDTDQNLNYELYKELYPDDYDVLKNEISRLNDASEKSAALESMERLLELYDNPLDRLKYELAKAGIDSDYERMTEIVDEMYDKFPHNYKAVISKYSFAKQLGREPREYNKILKDYFSERYSWDLMVELINNYIDEGNLTGALQLIEQTLDVDPQNDEAKKIKIELSAQRSDFHSAVKQANELLQVRPTDDALWRLYAALNQFIGNKREAREGYEKALMYFPFSFQSNESVRMLDDKPTAIELTTEVDVDEVIEDYKNNSTLGKEKSYNLVLDQKSVVLYKSRALGEFYHLIAEITNEEGLENWQHKSVGGGRNFYTKILEAKTIKKNGRKLDAERYGDEAVFANLEVGDFVYLKYSCTQTSGGKSSMFVNDRFYFNSYTPTYKSVFEVLYEKGMMLGNEVYNGELEKVVDDTEDFEVIKWEVVEPRTLPDENFPLPFSDIAMFAEIWVNFSWTDVAQWYSDMSEIQATPDFDVTEVVDNLFPSRDVSDEEKARIIYEYVAGEIQYSHIDFRQTSYIPQRASMVINTKLGDCKDVSTLYASIGREVGLDVNLLLVSTGDRGIKSVLGPTLNFNHCMVEVGVDDDKVILELTDKNLPYGYLYSHLTDSRILRIPFDEPISSSEVRYLVPNGGYESIIHRESSVQVNDDLTMEFSEDCAKVGAIAAGMTNSYYYESEKQQFKHMEQNVSSRFNSLTSLTNLDFKLLKPRADSAIYSYAYEVQNGVEKVGSFRSLKVPFIDTLAEIEVVQSDEREGDFHFKRYESVHEYKHSLQISLEGHTFIEIPDNVSLEFNGNQYSLEFEKVSPTEMRIYRSYKVNKENVSAEQFNEMRDFFVAINEAENTNLVFK